LIVNYRTKFEEVLIRERLWCAQMTNGCLHPIIYLSIYLSICIDIFPVFRQTIQSQLALELNLQESPAIADNPVPKIAY